MARHLLDHGHGADSAAQVRRFAALDRMKAGDRPHPSVMILERRRKGPANPARVKQYLRIARGHLA